MALHQKILVTDKVHPLLIEGLQKLNFEVDYDTSVENPVLKKIIDRYMGLIINSKIKMDRDMIDSGTQLAFIGRLGSGLEIIDVDYAKKKKIKVINSPEGNCNAVAEHEMAMLLALMNNLVRSDREVRTGIWEREKNRGRELKGKTLGIIGMGHTGCALATKLSSWELNVVSYDKYRKRYPRSVRYVRKCSLNEVLADSDILSLHLPLTDETNQLVNQSFIKKCKDGVILLNTSRGQIVDSVTLIQGLESGKIGGACLDVFENEKPSSFSDAEHEMYERLYRMENVILSPHIAGWTEESLTGIAEVLLTKICKTLNVKM